MNNNKWEINDSVFCVIPQINNDGTFSYHIEEDKVIDIDNYETVYFEHHDRIGVDFTEYKGVFPTEEDAKDYIKRQQEKTKQ